MQRVSEPKRERERERGRDIELRERTDTQLNIFMRTQPVQTSRLKLGVCVCEKERG